MRAADVDAERLGEDIHAGADEVVAHFVVRHVPGDEQHLQLRAMMPGAFHQLPTVEPGQTEVADQQIEALITVQVGQCTGRIAGFQHLVAELLQYFHHQHAHRRFVLHHQYDLATSGTWHVGRLRRPGLGLVVA